MTTMNNSRTAIKVVSIHDMDQRGFLSFDLLQILRAIEQAVREYSWIVTDMECTGEPAPTRTILSFNQLADYAQRVEQTINGAVVGVPPGDLAEVDLETVTRISDFPRSRARVAILAVDSSYFEVIAKDPVVITLIQQTFREVRAEDPRHYFGLG
jgi:hypothetical protein